MLDRQETFDRVLGHLREQGRPALNVSGLCSYRARNGDKCAVGALIPDEAYYPGLENFSADSDRVIDVIPGAVKEEDGPFLKGLQAVHDDADNDERAGRGDFADNVEKLAKEFAGSHGLEYDAPERREQ